MTQSYHQPQDSPSSFPQFDHADRERPIPQVPPTSTRRKLQKSRQKHIKPVHTVPASRHVAFARSESLRSGDSRHRLLPSDSPNRAPHARYPRSSQPSVLRKRRDNSHRSYHSFSVGGSGPRREGQQQQLAEHQLRIPHPDLVPVKSALRNRHSIGAEQLLIPNAPPSPVRRRWSMSEASHSTIHNNAGNIIFGKDKDLPPLPALEETTQNQPHASLSRRDSNLPPLPVFSGANPFVDETYQRRLCKDFIQGERLYLDTLRQCVKNEDIFAASLDFFLPLLSVIQVGEDFAVRMEASPTPQGIASSFLAICQPLETALLNWSEGIARIPVGEPELDQTPPPASTSRRNSILRSVSVLWNRRSNRPNNNNAPINTAKPDRIWQKQTSGPGLWEMSVLPARRVTQYRYLLGEILSTLPESHESFLEVERAFHAATCMSGRMTRSQEQLKV